MNYRRQNKRKKKTIFEVMNRTADLILIRGVTIGTCSVEENHNHDNITMGTFCP